MRLTTLSLVAALMLPLPALADTATLAQDYANLPAVQQMFDDMFSPEALAQQFKASVPPGTNVPEDKLSRIGALMSTEMNKLRPEMTRIMVSGMADVFTEEELSALIAFYSSEHGESAMRKMQPFMASIMGQLAPRMTEMQQATLPKIIAIMQE